MTKEGLKKELYHYIATQCTAISINMEHRLVYHYDQMEKVGEFIYNLEEKRIAELEQKLEQTEKDLADYQFNYPKIKELEEENNKLLDVINNQDVKIADLEKQIEKMKKYGKLLQDICVVLGNDSYMVAVQLECVVEKLWDSSEEKEGLKMVDEIRERLLKISAIDWAEIGKWEIKE